MPQDILSRLQSADPWLLAAAAVLGSIVVSFWWAWRLRRAVAIADDAAAERQRTMLAQLEHQFEQRMAERARALERTEGRLQQSEGQLAALHQELDGRIEALGRHREAEASLRTRLEENHRHNAEKEALFLENGAALKQEFERLAARIFDRQGDQQQVRLQARLADVLKPFAQQLSDFRQRVDAVYDTETRDRASLLVEVRNLAQSSDRINREAENLTRALKGDVKAQGNWGELVLERVLEDSGLRAGHEYLLQASRRDREGALKRPDVLIRLPDDKDVVVDAKLSLLAYEEALAEEEPRAREAAAGRHVASLRAHVKRLAEQSYDQLEDVRSLDFVLLFVPIEAAFSMAMEHDPRLFTDAFERRIVVVSPTTLLMTLRIIHNVWQYEGRNRNAQEIARRAGALYDKLRGFVEDMESVGRQLDALDSTYKTAFAKLTTGKGNLLRRVESFRELGAPVKKAMPTHLFDDDEVEVGPVPEPGRHEDDSLDIGEEPEASSKSD